MILQIQNQIMVNTGTGQNIKKKIKTDKKRKLMNMIKKYPNFIIKMKYISHYRKIHRRYKKK